MQCDALAGACQPRLRENRISMPLFVEEFMRGRDFTVARINELEEDGQGGRGFKVKTAHTAMP